MKWATFVLLASFALACGAAPAGDTGGGEKALTSPDSSGEVGSVDATSVDPWAQVHDDDEVQPMDLGSTDSGVHVDAGCQTSSVLKDRMLMRCGEMYCIAVQDQETCNWSCGALPDGKPPLLFQDAPQDYVLQGCSSAE